MVPNLPEQLDDGQTLKACNIQNWSTLCFRLAEASTEGSCLAAHAMLRDSDFKKVMKLAQGKNNLVKKLNLRSEFVTAMIEFYLFAIVAKSKDISWSLDPDIYRQEALKYAKMFGDRYIHLYHSSIMN